MKLRKNSAFTLIELLVVISIIAILAALLMPNFGSIMSKGKMTGQMSNGVGIFKAMANYATDPRDDSYPIYTDREDPSTKVSNSNQAFEILLAKKLIDDKKVFFQNGSAWCKKQVNSEATKDKVQQGENDWCYMVGLRRTSPSSWPILANAFSPGGTTYVKDQSQKGGVWKGINAVVVYNGGNGEVVETLEQGSSYIVRRTDKPKANAFEKDGEWLAGDDVQLLYPQ